MSVSALMRHSQKYEIPFHVIIASEFFHEPIMSYNSKYELSLIFAKTIFDTPRPYQLEDVKKNLKPVRGIMVVYDDDPAIDCNNGIKKYLIRTTDYESNLKHFLKIRSEGNNLLELMVQRLHKDKYIQKLVDKRIIYHIHKENRVLPPKNLSVLVKQYELYCNGYSIKESTRLALKTGNFE